MKGASANWKQLGVYGPARRNKKYSGSYRQAPAGHDAKLARAVQKAAQRKADKQRQAQRLGAKRMPLENTKLRPTTAMRGR